MPLWGDKKPESNAGRGQRVTHLMELKSESARVGCLFLPTFPNQGQGRPWPSSGESV